MKFSVLMLFFVLGSPCRKVDIKHAESEREYKVEVKGVAFDRASGLPVVILYEPETKRALPIWIGFAEARAIKMFLDGVTPPRPITHELMKNIVENMGGNILRITITELKNNTFYAEIMIKVKDEILVIDSRPSDAIALALRSASLIFVREKVLQAAMKMEDDELWEKVGISVQEIRGELKKFFGERGLIVSDVKEGSKAESAGLKRGDVIVKCNGKKVKTRKALEEGLSGGKGELEILRGSKTVKIKLE